MKIRPNETRDFSFGAGYGGGRVRLLNDAQPDRCYYKIDYAGTEFAIQSEIVWLANSLTAFNYARRTHGNRLLNITNLESGQIVFGATR